MVNISAEVGSMNFGSGSHKFGYLGEMAISDDSERAIADFIVSKGIETHNYGCMNAGDATFHAGWTLHGAPGNPTPSVREVMTVIYVAADARIV